MTDGDMYSVHNIVSLYMSVIGLYMYVVNLLLPVLGSIMGLRHVNNT